MKRDENPQQITHRNEVITIHNIILLFYFGSMFMRMGKYVILLIFYASQVQHYIWYFFFHYFFVLSLEIFVWLFVVLIRINWTNESF